ncbi:MAG: MFS transporter [Methanotrichaceae archaeon]|nr:MFS transporter [Methanotrichaceae archaeon]
MKETNGALAPIFLSVFVAVLGISLVAPIFPMYVMGLGASYTQLGFIVSIYGAVQLHIQIPIGRLSDHIGRKGLILLGLMSFTIMPPLYIYATNVYSLIPIRVLGGIGASAVWPLAMVLIVDQASREKRGSAMGWYNAVFYSALALGPLMGGWLYDQFGLEAPFYFWALLGLVSVIIVFKKVDDPGKQVLTANRPIVHKTDKLIVQGFFATFLACCGVVMLAGIVGGFNFTMLPSYASQLGLSATEIGLLYLVFGSSTAISNIQFGKQADKGKRKLLIFSGCVLSTVSFALLLEAVTLVQVVILLATLGIGLGMGSPAAAALIADAARPSRRGEIFGIFNTSRMAGIVIGPLIAGLTADRYGVNGAIIVFTSIALAITLMTLFIKDPPVHP